MKKSVLLLLAAGVWVCADAQSNSQTRTLPISRVQSSALYNAPKDENAAAKPVENNNAKKLNHNTHRASNVMAVVNKVPVSGSWNLFSALTAACTQLTYNTTLHMIGFTHRESSNYPQATYGVGAYETDFSTDFGATWDTTTVVNRYTGTSTGTRYPNGVILNPKGNVTPNMAYAVSCGPHVSGTTWDSSYFSSSRLNSTNLNQQRKIMYPNVTATLYTFSPPHYETVCDDSTVHFVQEAWTYTTSAYTTVGGFYGAIVNTGTWSSVTNSVTWTTKVLRPHLVSYSDTSLHNDTNAELAHVAMAWSQDGKTGYVVFFGNLDSANYAYDYESLQPIVYKTTDNGTTWNMMPMFNFGTLPSLVQYIRPSIDNPLVKLPMWDINGDSGFYYGHDVDVTVDTNNNLHIFGAIAPGALANPDSGGYQYNPAPSGGRYIYDVYTTTATGGWQATFIDSLHTPMGAAGSQTVWNLPAPGIGYGARIQATRTQGGGKVFCTWTDDVIGDATLVNPDIFTAEIDANTHVVYGPTQVTSDANNFFLMVGDIAYANGGCWNIPCAVVFDPSAPDAGTTPIRYNYVQGVCAVDGVNEIKTTATAFSVSQNFPNPFNNLTSFNVNVNEVSTVSVDVYNMVGQKVWSMSPEKMEPGTHMVTINGAFSAGVYFYRVIANGSSVTHKMVVE